MWIPNLQGISRLTVESMLILLFGMYDLKQGQQKQYSVIIITWNSYRLKIENMNVFGTLWCMESKNQQYWYFLSKSEVTCMKYGIVQFSRDYFLQGIRERGGQSVLFKLLKCTTLQFTRPSEHPWASKSWQINWQMCITVTQNLMTELLKISIHTYTLHLYLYRSIIIPVDHAYVLCQCVIQFIEVYFAKNKIL